jgi:hydroxymethylbilane synthase
MNETNRNRLVVGTRGSELALVQATATERALASAFPAVAVERKVIRTTGDRRTDVALSQVAAAEGVIDKGVFTKELEIALEAGEIDIAVHSLKDVPTVVGKQFEIAGVLERAGVRDMLVSLRPGGPDALPAGAIVGTSSVRRARQIQWLRPDLQISDLRGNVPTRLRKLADGGVYDAILLAEAGLARLGFLGDGEQARGEVPGLDISGLHFTPLEENWFFPAAGQGAIGFEIRSDDDWAREVVRAICHRETFLRVRAEREFLRLLDAGCHTPVGVSSELRDGVLSMKGRVFPESGGDPQTGTAQGPDSDPEDVARMLFESLS